MTKDASDRTVFNYNDPIALTIEHDTGVGTIETVATLTSKLDPLGSWACFDVPNLPGRTYTVRATSGTLAPATAPYTVASLPTDTPAETPTSTPTPSPTVVLTPTLTPIPTHVAMGNGASQSSE